MLLSLQGIKQRKALAREELFVGVCFEPVLLGEISSRKIRALPGPRPFLKSQIYRAQQSCGKEGSHFRGEQRGGGSLEAEEEREPH